MSHFSTNEDIELQIDDGSGTPHVDVNVDLTESTSSSFATHAHVRWHPFCDGSGLSAAMHMNSRLLVLESSIITADEAVRFEAQAKSMPHLKLAQVMLHRYKIQGDLILWSNWSILYRSFHLCGIYAIL